MSDEFRKAVADVKPLRHGRRVRLAGPAPAPEAAQRKHDEAAALRESLDGPVSLDDALDSGEELAYLREGLSRQVLKKVRRGHWSVLEAGPRSSTGRAGRQTLPSMSTSTRFRRPRS